MNYGNFEPSLVVGWLEVQLFSNSSSCGRYCVRSEPRFDIDCNHVDCKVYGILD